MNRDHGAFQADGRSNWERMIAGDWYIGDDPKMSEVSRRAQRLLKLHEAAFPEDPDIAHYLLEQVLGSVGQRVTIRPPFRVDYGINIHIGEGVWANYGLTALDVAEIRIGNDVLIGPNCQLLTPIHPLEHGPRREGWESAEPITIEEPTEEESIKILEGIKERYEEHHQVLIEEEAILAAVKLSARYINDRYLPDKAIDLIDEASSKIRILNSGEPAAIKKLRAQIAEFEEEKEDCIRREDFEGASQIKKKQEQRRKRLSKELELWKTEREENRLHVRESDIAQVVSDWTKIPTKKLEETESERLKNLENLLHERVIGQNEAVKAVSQAIKRGRVGLKDPKRPIGSFMFLGPTGVGKTELSKAIAEVIFGSEQNLIRVDMSEYMEKYSVSKMIGSPPGYVGYDEGGQLSEKVRRNPYSVILFDEIEKAHPDVLNILLQVLDDGHITDSQGRKVSFKNTIIIMTSNAGAEQIISPKKLGFDTTPGQLDKDYQYMKNKVLEELKNLFRPEFLNRIDEIIVFRPISKEDMSKILDILLSQLYKRAKGELDLGLRLDKGAKDFLVEKGYDPKFGARPLKRTIQTQVEDLLSEAILEGEIPQGSLVTVKMDRTGEKLKTSIRKRKEECQKV